MQTRRLGKNGPEVPVICLGTWPVGGAFGIVEESESIAMIHAAIDAGVTFIDTAEGYRNSEVVLGKALRGRRHKVFLATKLSGTDHSREHMEKAIASSLEALGTGYIDLYQLHSYQARWPLEHTMENLLRLRDAGTIRYIGVSNFSGAQTADAMQYGPVHSSQPRYSLLFRDTEKEILPFCLKHGVGVIAHSVLAKGLLGGRYKPGHEFPPDDERHYWPPFQGETFRQIYEFTERLKVWAADHGRDIVQLAIAWPLAHAGVTASIVGAKTPEQIRQNARAGDWNLTSQDLAEIDEIKGDLNPVYQFPTQMPPIPEKHKRS